MLHSKYYCMVVTEYNYVLLLPSTRILKNLCKLASFMQMTGRFRLTAHRKNEYRKRRTLKRGYTVKIVQSFPICILLDLVTVLKVSISRHIMQLVSSMHDIRCKLQASPVFHTG